MLPRPLALLIDAVLPPRCPGCGTIVDGDHHLCADCWQALAFLPDDGCTGCNRPIASTDGPFCASCLSGIPPHGRVHAAVAYGPVARAVILKLKYARRPGYAAIVARLAGRTVDWPPETLLVPVPLHHRRLWQRGYNQATEIARRLARERGLEFDPAALSRRRATPVLRGLGYKARDRAVRGAFAARRRFDGRHVVLVDDVYTTGATTNACARVVLRAGAASVAVICWARVLEDD